MLNLDDLVPPPIDGDLRSLFEEAGTAVHAALACAALMSPSAAAAFPGATLDDDGVALSFGDDEAALEALADGMMVFDRSHWVRQLRCAAYGRRMRGRLTLRPALSLPGRAACAFRARARWRSCRRR